MSLTATPEDVRAAYRLFLNREPDEPGFAHWMAEIAAGRLDLDGLKRMITGSVEYAQLGWAERAVDIGGAVVFVDPQDADFGAHIATYQGWEPHIRALLARHLQPGHVFADIGANLGIMAFDAARLVGPEGRVLAFEPDRHNMRRLLRAITANGFTQVQAFQLALSDERRVLSMTGNSNGSVVDASYDLEMVQAIPGDDMLLGLPRLDMVKIDIEGHEPAALKGIARSLARHRPWVIVEFNPLRLGGIQSDGCVALMQRVFSLTGRVMAVQHDGAETPIDSIEALAALWRLRDAEVTASGFLPAGWVHMDLLFRVA